MEKPNFLQQPGGLGPLPGLKPLGMPMANPSAYMNDEISITARRQAYSDDVNRIFAQYNIDHGTYSRTPVNPLPYAEGNITKSDQLTGLAGYNHKEIPLPQRAVDIPKEQYLAETSLAQNPTTRGNVQALTVLPQQNFLNTQDPNQMMYTQDYRTSDDMSLQEQILGGKK